MLDYFEIGQRIRNLRKNNGVSQEALAEKVGISVTHMSHIETGNTRVSLPVLADIAAVLRTTVDSLLSERMADDRTVMMQEIEKLLYSCSSRQARIITDLLKNLKYSMEQFGEVEETDIVN